MRIQGLRFAMTYVVTDNCIKCKYMDCVEVCPVDCFYEGENMLVIHPDECIDCGVCEPECPVDAIKPDTEPGLGEMAGGQRRIRREVAATSPRRSRHAAEAEQSDDGEPDKIEKYFSPSPARADGENTPDRAVSGICSTRHGLETFARHAYLRRADSGQPLLTTRFICCDRLSWMRKTCPG